MSNTIHQTKPTAQSLLKNYLQGSPVEVTDTGLVFSQSISETELRRVGSQLLNASKEFTFLLNFCLGDFYNKLPAEKYGDKADAIRSMFGEGSYERLKSCGRVAGAWKANMRDEDVPWQFYKVTASIKDPSEKQRYLILFRGGLITIKEIEAEKGENTNVDALFEKWFQKGNELLEKHPRLWNRLHLRVQSHTTPISSEDGIHYLNNFMADTVQADSERYPADTVLRGNEDFPLTEREGRHIQA